MRTAPEALFNSSDLAGGFGAIANRVYLHAKLLQVALTEELLGEAEGTLRFTNGNALRSSHARSSHARVLQHESAEVGRADDGAPSTWAVCGTYIPIARSGATFLPKLVRKGVLDPYIFHAYEQTNDQYGGGAPVTQTWTIPSCWHGKKLTATVIGPDGLSPGPELSQSGGQLTLNVQPGRPVRIEAK